ncbi:hypothetical protein [Thermococcus sp. MAR1]|uniref:hypothetical protein n=1 Tax=Thermococcus sp. MAR1 TaxID=1638263 RepID=UPI00143871F3|nr:hypothetical protein [Thermococcus sp. MAR1]NJE09330.1 hypothetical protein [Thermococcus sp. MAR1]
MEKPASKTKLAVAAPIVLLALVVAVHYIVNLPPRGASPDFKAIWRYGEKIDGEEKIMYKVVKYRPAEVHFYCYPECHLYPGDKPIPEPFFSQEPFFFPRFTIEAKKIVVWSGIVTEGQSLDIRKPRIEHRDPFTDFVYRIDGSLLVDLGTSVDWKLRFVRKDHLVAVAIVRGRAPMGLAVVGLTPTTAPMNTES